MGGQSELVGTIETICACLSEDRSWPTPVSLKPSCI